MSSRAITSFWICEVPSPISMSLASRKYRSTVDLDGGVGGLHRDGRGQELRHRGLARERKAAVLEACRLVDQEPRRLDPGGHVREQELDRLELGDRLPELPPLARVLERGVQRGLRDSDRHRPDRDAPAVEGLHELLEALAFLAFLLEEILLGQLHVLEEELHGVA